MLHQRDQPVTNPNISPAICCGRSGECHLGHPAVLFDLAGAVNSVLLSHRPHAMPLTIAFIGAGSIGFTRKICRDLLGVPEFSEIHFRLHDIDPEGLEQVRQLIAKDVTDNRLGAQVGAFPNRREALEGADYVINCTRIGGLEAFKGDIEIPLKYGVDQCVGDTLAPGGILYGQRNIPALLDFCRDIRECSQGEVLLMNYANPMAINTWAALAYGNVDTVGLCHGVQGSHQLIAKALGVKPYTDLNILAAGINHQTWFVDIRHCGRRIGSEELLAAFESSAELMVQEPLRIDVLRRFGYFSTESNGHLGEYLSWYRKRPDELKEWIDLRTWIGGETGGYLRYCRERNERFKAGFDDTVSKEEPPITAEDRSIEHGSWIIEARETGRVYRGHFNVRNNGAISNLADDAIVEVPGFVDCHGIHTVRVGPLPQACAATCSASINVQRMAVEAAVHGDVGLLKQAVLHDPLTAAVCTPEEVWQMVDEMLVAQAEWLPQFVANGSVAAAEERMRTTKPLKLRSAEGIRYQRPNAGASHAAWQKELQAAQANTPTSH